MCVRPVKNIINCSRLEENSQRFLVVARIEETLQNLQIISLRKKSIEQIKPTKPGCTEK